MATTPQKISQNHESCKHCNISPESIPEAKTKLSLGSMLEHGEWFKYFDENFLPIEVEKSKETYQVALKNFRNKCLTAFKYYRQCEKYEHDLKHEMEEIARLELEVKDLESMYKNHMEIALRAADFVENFNQEVLNSLLPFEQGPKDIMIAFQALLCLGPEGTQGGSDVSWDAIKSLLKDKNALAVIMRDLLKTRVKDISRAEIDNAQHTIKHFINEFAGEDKKNFKSFARAVAFYVHCCIGCWDLNEGIEARKELISTKTSKLQHLRNEANICQDIVRVLDNDVGRDFEKYKRVRAEYLFVEKEKAEADEVMKNFTEHCVQIDMENAKGLKDTERIEALLKELESDCEAFDILQMKMNYPVIEDPQNS